MTSRHDVRSCCTVMTLSHRGIQVDRREDRLGFELVTECMGTPSDDLTWRERFALLVLAREACDATRLCPPGIESAPEIVARLRLSRSARYEVLSALCEKAALVHVERGRNGVDAVYAIAPFAPGGPERPGYPDAPPVTVKGPGFTDATTGAKGPGFTDATALKGPGFTTQASGVSGPLAAEGSGFHVVKGPGSTDASRARSGSLGFKDLKTNPPTPPTPPAPYQPPLLAAVANPGEGGREFPAQGNPELLALAAEVGRARPEWSARSVRRVLERPGIAARPWPLVVAAMRLVAADPGTKYPGRLEHDGPWWADAAAAARASAAPAAQRDAGHQYDEDPETRLCRHCRGTEVDKRHTRRRTA